MWFYVVCDIVFFGGDDYVVFYLYKDEGVIVGFLQLMNIGEIVLKCGVDNVEIYCNNEYVSVVVMLVQIVVDIILVGDVFIGGYLVVKLVGFMSVDVVVMGVEVVGVVIGVKGVIVLVDYY